MKAYQASKFPRSCALHSFLFFSLPPLSLFAITRLRSANKSGPVSIYNLTVSSPFSSFSLSLWHTHATDHGPPLRPARIPANLCNYRAAARPISSMALGARRRTNTRAREEERRTSYRSYVHHWPAQHPPTTLSLQPMKNFTGSWKRAWCDSFSFFLKWKGNFFEFERKGDSRGNNMGGGESDKASEWQLTTKGIYVRDDMPVEAEVGCKPEQNCSRGSVVHARWNTDNGTVKHELVHLLVCQWEVAPPRRCSLLADTSRYLLSWCHHFSRRLEVANA